MTERLSDERLEEIGRILTWERFAAPRIGRSDLIALLREVQEARRVEVTPVLCCDCAEEAGVGASACEGCGAELA